MLPVSSPVLFEQEQQLTIASKRGDFVWNPVSENPVDPYNLYKTKYRSYLFPLYYFNTYYGLRPILI